jgi:hypothetical protein
VIRTAALGGVRSRFPCVLQFPLGLKDLAIAVRMRLDKVLDIGPRTSYGVVPTSSSRINGADLAATAGQHFWTDFGLIALA